MQYQERGQTEHYTGRGVRFNLLGSIFSRNRFKAEKTIKSLPREYKIGIAKKGARKFFGW
jgi:hypothetical protein